MARFYMMIGISGSGKSTYARSLSPDAVIISSDEIRKEIYGSEEIQDNPAKVFEIMYDRTIAALRNDKNVIYDATNISRKRRVDLLSKLPKGTFKIGVVVSTSIDECFRRNDARDRKVPHEVIIRQLYGFEVPIYSEGFDHITIVMSDSENEWKYITLCDKITHDNPWHKRKVGKHIRAMMEAAEEMHNTDLYLLCKYHDIGKAITKTIDENGVGHFYRHEQVGAYITLNLTGDIRIAALVGEHMKLHNEHFNQEKLKRFFPEEDIELLRRLRELDVTYA